MGTFAFSLHVRADAVEPVVQAVVDAFDGLGYRPTDEEPSPGDLGMGSPFRRVRISEAREGWVSLLDSDPAGMPALAAEVSRRLSTYAIWVDVNDSDSWDYQLYRDGQTVDQFCSVPDEGLHGVADMWGPAQERLDAGLRALQAIADRLSLLPRPPASRPRYGSPAMDEIDALFGPDPEAALRAIIQRYERAEAELLAAMPEDAAETYRRLAAGAGTPEDTGRFAEWVEASLPVIHGLTQDIPADFPAAVGGVRIQIGPTKQQSAAERKDSEERFIRRCAAQWASQAEAHAMHARDLTAHAAALRDLLAPGHADQELLEALAAQPNFAEEALEAFLPLIGVAGYYANLSYDLPWGSESEELAAQGLRFAAQPTFTR